MVTNCCVPVTLPKSFCFNRTQTTVFADVAPKANKSCEIFWWMIYLSIWNCFSFSTDNFDVQLAWFWHILAVAQETTSPIVALIFSKNIHQTKSPVVFPFQELSYHFSSASRCLPHGLACQKAHLPARSQFVRTVDNHLQTMGRVNHKKKRWDQTFLRDIELFILVDRENTGM